MANEEEYGPDLITLVDEDGKEQEFELIDDTELEDGSRFVALVPYYEKPEDSLQADADLVIMQVFEEDGEEYLEAVEDDELYERVSKIFIDNLSDEYDIVTDDEE